MAWILDQKLADRWVVRALSREVEVDLFHKRETFRAAHPELFPTGVPIDFHGIHLPLELFPTEARVQTSTRNPPDFLTMAGFAVSERVMRLFGMLEPDVHQFVEVPTYLRNGDLAPQRYYAVALGHAAYRQVDFERSTIRRNEDGSIWSPDRTYRYGHIAINRDETAGWHAWFSHDIFNHLTISNDLYKLFRAENIPGIDYIQLLEPGQAAGEVLW